MLGLNHLASVETSSRLNQLVYRVDLTKSIFEQKQPTLNQRESKRETDGFGKIVEIRKQVTEEELGQVIEATIIDHSVKGCGLLIASKESPKLQDIYQLSTVKFDPRIISIIAKVVWSQKLANDIYRIGLEYIDLVEA